MVTKKRMLYSNFIGKKTEDKFCNLMISRGNDCVKSRPHDNISNHIDFFVNGKGVDVKGSRHLETIWLELKNVNGYKGWLLGKAKYIVFDIEELKSFCFYDRVKLYNFVKDIKEIAKDKTEYMKLYTRENRNDVIVKVTYDDIKHLEFQQIPYE